MQVVGGQLIQSPGNPIFPGTHVTGPLLAGNIKDWDGGAGLAGLGSTNPGVLANVGYAKMIQAGRVTQAASPGQPPGVFVSPDLVIPAQSLIVAIASIVLVAFTGAASTFGIGNTVNPIAFTPAGAMTAPATEVITAAVAPQLQNWLNCGPIDEQFVFTSSNTGAGVMIVLIEYIQGINAATS
jgi:hypothetical protein